MIVRINSGQLNCIAKSAMLQGQCCLAPQLVIDCHHTKPNLGFQISFVESG